MAHPPEGFQALRAIDNVPAFSAHFDLLTTAEATTKRRVMSLPLYSRWRSMLAPRTCFIGTTVSEYALFPDEITPLDLLRKIKNAYASHYPIVIVKDIPQRSPLLDAAASDYARQLLVACDAERFVVLEGQALAYVPLTFDSVEQYLAKFSRSRRKDIQRKLRAGSAVELSIASTGAEEFRDTEFLAELYSLYANVYERSDLHFDQLSSDFLRSILQDAHSGGRVFLYRLQGRLIGFNLCYVQSNFLVDKYVGFLYPQARHVGLYSRSWIENVRYALEQGLTHYVVGWTDPQVKRDLGASFTFTRHAVYVRNRLLRALLRRVAGRFESDRIWHEHNAA